MKLIEHIKAVETGNRRPIEEPLYKIALSVDSASSLQFNYAKEYRITVTLGANKFIAEDLIQQSRGKVVEYAVRDMKHAIVETVYGELRRDLLELRMELRNELNHYNSPTVEQLDKIIDKISM